jgi:hypothetical protein
VSYICGIISDICQPFTDINRLEDYQMDLFTPEIQKELLAFLSSLVGLVIVVFGSIASYLAVKAKAYIAGKIGQDQYRWLMDYIASSVAAVAQNPLYESIANDLKKEKVVEWVEQFCAQYKLPFSKEQIDILVEDAYADWKAWQDKK